MSSAPAKIILTEIKKIHTHLSNNLVIGTFIVPFLIKKARFAFLRKAGSLFVRSGQTWLIALFRVVSYVNARSNRAGKSQNSKYCRNAKK